MKNIKILFKLIDILFTVFLFYLCLFKFYIVTKLFFMCITISLFVFIIQIIKMKQRLNYIYTYSVKKNKQEIELHYDPLLFFHFINKDKLISFQSSAISKLFRKNTNVFIIGKTLTIHSINKKIGHKAIKNYSFKNRLFAIIPSLFLTIANFYNLYSLTLSKKIFYILFINNFSKYEYKKDGEL